MSKSGRRNPPEHSRFKKGVSGNRKGRPPKRRKRQLVSEIVSEVQNTPTAYLEAIILRLGDASDGPKQKLACEKKTNEFGDPLPSGTTVFPGQAFSISSYAIVPRQAWEDAIKENLGRSGGHVSAGLVFAGCVRYEFAVDHSAHRPFFAYQVSRNGSPLGAQLDEVDPKEFIFVPSIGSGAFDAD